jgi:hypothetical protein|tara:strand:+ start:760 stop:1371 length:612 start_codon:yes stop_codon:yes gene_type:complete
MIILDHDQGTEEWFAARLGKPSASCFSKLITTKGKPSTSSVGYVDQLVAEKLTGKSEPFYSNDHMIRGTELEPEAREAYEFISGNEVTEVGFIVDTKFEYGCSPDGLIGSYGGIEIKCPAAPTMVKYLRDPNELVKAYFQQIQGCMYVTGARWWEAFAYHPEMAHVLIRVDRDDEFIEKLAVEIKSAVSLIQTTVEKLNENRN